MAHSGDVVGVDVPLRYQVIDATLETPGPGGDGATMRRVVPGWVAAGEPGVDTGAGFLAVCVDVPAIECREPVTATEDLRQRPILGLAAAGGFSSGIVRAALA